MIVHFGFLFDKVSKGEPQNGDVHNSERLGIELVHVTMLPSREVLVRSRGPITARNGRPSRIRPSNVSNLLAEALFRNWSVAVGGYFSSGQNPIMIGVSQSDLVVIEGCFRQHNLLLGWE
jgi:hypothetical protein